MKQFFVGLDDVYNAKHVAAACISVNRLRRRKTPFAVNDWIMDSGAFTMIAKNGRYLEGPSAYAAQIKRWSGNSNLLSAVAQDYMCEEYACASVAFAEGLIAPDPIKLAAALAKLRRRYAQPSAAKVRDAHVTSCLPLEPAFWRSRIAEHQRLTVERYDALTPRDVGGVYIMPVLQGYAPAEYVAHIRQYGDRLAYGAWVGVGSVCKRNGDATAIEDVLLAIKRERPDLRLHGFGVKRTALGSGLVRDLLHTADSMAWSFAARWEGRDAHDINEALRFVERIATMPVQERMLFEGEA